MEFLLVLMFLLLFFSLHRMQDMAECDLVDDEDLKKQGMMEVVFRTVNESRNCGRSYIFRTGEDDAQEWEDVTDPCFERAQDKVHEQHMQETYGHSCFEMTRARRKLMIKSNEWQYMLAVIIILGFACDVLAAQVLPHRESREAAAFFGLDCIVTSFFTMDLMVNMFANSSNWFRPFYTEPANSFDLLIVGVSLASLYMDHQDIKSPPIKMIRLIRVLKVLNLIHFLAPLNRLVKSIGFCVCPFKLAVCALDRLLHLNRH